MVKLLSIKNALLLIIIGFLSITIATYIENSESKKSAWDVVYSSFWFEFLFYLIIAVLIFNIFHFKMYKKEKLPSFVFHLSFILIIIGAIVTKYYSYKGHMFVEKNQISNQLISIEDYLQIKTSVNNKEVKILSEDFGSLDKQYNINNRFLKLKDKNFIKFGKQKVIKDDNSRVGVMAFEILTKNNRESFFFEDKNILSLKNVDILFNLKPKNENKPYFKIDAHESKRIQFISNLDITTNFEEKFEKNKFHEFHQGIIYNINGNNLLVNDIITLGRIDFVEDEKGDSALILDVTYDGKTKELALIQKNNSFKYMTNNIYFDDKEFIISFGKKFSELPFSIKLNNYNLENYAGSNDILTYESSVELSDGKIKVEDTIKINKPLTYGFFTIFQTKYENHDATFLDINYNPGKWFIYIGYILLTAGLVLNLFNPNSRFRKLLSSTK